MLYVIYGVAAATLLLGLSPASWAQDSPGEPIESPRQERADVEDRAELLAPDERAQLHELLRLHNRKGPEVVRLIIISKLPETESIEDFAQSLLLEDLETPGVTQERVLLLVSVADRKLRLATSDAIRPSLPDTFCEEVIDNQILPRFRRGEFYDGIRAGLGAIMARLGGERPAMLPNATPPSVEDAERVLVILQTEKRHQERLEALDALNRRSFAERFGGEMSLTADQRQITETAVAAVSQIVRAELAYTRIKPDLIRIIQETYSNQELSGILDLHATPWRFSGVEERFARYLLDRMDAAGPKIQAAIDRKLRELRIAQLDTTSEPLSQLEGDWFITTFLFGGGHLGISACGLEHQSASILSRSDGMIEISAACKDGGQYDLRLVRSIDKRNYLLTVKNREGISVIDFPLNYLGSKGWMGSAQQVVGDKEISISAYITPIEGKTWYGWATWVRPTAEAGIDSGKAKTSYLKVDFIRRK